MSTVTHQWPDVRFRPRRLGHVNLWVGDLEQSHAFYRDVCGLALVFDEPGIEARFYSNGNSHHDLALMQSSGRAHRGRDGHLQVAAERGRDAGLNHIAFEMATECDLVAGLTRARDGAYPVAQTVDHQISRSAYLTDPDGLGVEVYADAAEHFLVTYERVRQQLLTELWDPFAADPSAAEHFEHEPTPLGVDTAPVQPRRAAQATLAVTDLAQAIAFYESVLGLRLIRGAVSDGIAVLGGALGLADLVLVDAGGAPAYLHHITFELAAATDVPGLATAIEHAGVRVEQIVDHAAKRSIVLIDPDGLPVEFAVPDASGELRAAAPGGWDRVL